MNPEFSPGLGVRNAGRPDSAGSTSMAMRRSASEPISQMRERHDVGGKSDRLGMEVAARQGLAGVGEDQRIVGHAVGFGRQRRRGVAQDVEHGAHDLRLAAQAVGILHAIIADQMRGADGAMPAISSRNDVRPSICPAWRRSAWMRGSNGASEPRAASVDNAPVTSAEPNSISVSNSAASA